MTCDDVCNFGIVQMSSHMKMHHNTGRSLLNRFSVSWKPSTLRLSKDSFWYFCAGGTQRHNPTFFGSRSVWHIFAPYLPGNEVRYITPIKFQEQVKSVASRACWKTHIDDRKRMNVISPPHPTPLHSAPPHIHAQRKITCVWDGNKSGKTCCAQNYCKNACLVQVAISVANINNYNYGPSGCSSDWGIKETLWDTVGKNREHRPCTCKVKSSGAVQPVLQPCRKRRPS